MLIRRNDIQTPQWIYQSLKRQFQNRRSLLPVPLALATSLTFVYLASGNFDPNDLALSESDVQNEQCATQLEQKNPLDGIAHLPETEIAAGETVPQPCATSIDAAADDSGSWASLWPRPKFKPPRG